MFERVRAVCRATKVTYEIVVVDDGSQDLSWKALCEQAQIHGDVRAFKLSRNFGQQKALAAGLAQARGERIFILDADLQDPPEMLPEMMRLMDQGFHCVNGQRRTRAGESLLKIATAEFFYWFVNLLSDIDIPRNTGDFRLISRPMLDAFLAMPEDRRFIRLMLAWVGFRHIEIPYDRKPRVAGKTKYNYRRMLNLAVDGITSFSIRPLKVAMFFAFSAVVVAGVIFIWALRAWLLGGSVLGWASLIITVLVLGACQLFVLGILGEYLGRLFIEQKRRPTFLIEASSEADPNLLRPDTVADTQPVGKPALG